MSIPRKFPRNTAQNIIDCNEMANPFFDVLPEDLQFHILSKWIDDGLGLLESLSCLDIACCGDNRSSLLFLFSQLFPFTVSFRTPDMLTTANYMQWLHSRNVKVRSLHVTIDEDGNPQHSLSQPIHLAAVENLFLIGKEASMLSILEVILRSCPNVTSLEFDKFTNRGSVEFTPAVVALVPKLTALISGGVVSDRSIKAVGGQLK